MVVDFQLPQEGVLAKEAALMDPVKPVNVKATVAATIAMFLIN